MKTDSKRVALVASKTNWTPVPYVVQGYWNNRYDRGTERVLVRYGPTNDLVIDLMLINKVSGKYVTAQQRDKANQLINILIRDER